MSAPEETATGPQTPEHPTQQTRKSSFDQPRVDHLQRLIGRRPEENELVERGILKDTHVAPALQAAKGQLEKNQLKHKLDHALQQRPKPEELVKEGILNEDEAPIA